MTRRTVGPARWRRLTMAATAMAVSVGLSLVALPMSGAAPSTKNYSVAPTSPPAPIFVGVPYSATFTLTNDPSSNQSFGSVQLSTVPQTSIAVVGTTPALGWHVTSLASGVVQLTSDNGAAIAPGHTLAVGVTITATTAGSLTVATAVKQSNDFSGSNNSFTNTGTDPKLVVTAPLPCTGTVSCSEHLTSSTTGVTADLSVIGSGTFTLFASFGQGVALSCSSLVASVTADPLVVYTSVAGTSGTVTMTFPKSVVNSLANNGTPQMPVCVGANKAFAGTNLVSPPLSSLYEGLLYDCDNPLYLNPGGLPKLFCVQSRAKIGGGGETIVIQVNNFGDPDFW